MFKKTAGALLVSCALGAASGVQADTFLFNPAGTGAAGAVTATAFDELQGNTLAVNAVPAAVGSIISDLYQANLNSVVNGSTSVFTNGTGGVWFTVVAGFSEQVVSSNLAAGFGTQVFDNTAATQGLPSFFRICVQGAVGNDLTGAGFACTDANAILTGTLADILGAEVTTNFNNGAVTLDQFTGDNWSGQRSVTSTGSANILVNITGVNAGYFPDLLVGSQLITAITNTSLITPFSQQNPSYCFSSNGTTSSTSGTTACSPGTFQAFGTLGAINGDPGIIGATPSGPNFIFQADANTTFARSVPEPGTIALFGLGLAAVSVLGRRRKSRDPA